MSSATDLGGTPPQAPFHDVICGIDGSEQGVEAARQGVALAAHEAKLWGVSVWDTGLAMMGGIHASEVMVDLRRHADEALHAATAEIPRLEPLLMRGRDVSGLLAAVANLDADLIAVGAHGHSRPAGILFGSVATAVSHHATCTALIARSGHGTPFPGLILHANDGSEEAADAARVAGQIAAMHGSTVMTLHVADEGHAESGRGIAEASVALIEAAGREPVVEVVQGSPHRRIIEIAHDSAASLIVIGGRGRTGLRALGSVSERVAHHAPCSVLLVRAATHPLPEDEWPLPRSA